MFSKKLEEEVKHLKKEVAILKEELLRRPSDEVKDAKQASKMCSQYKNRCLTTQESIESLHKELSAKITNLNDQVAGARKMISDITEISNDAKSSTISIQNIQKQISTIDNLFDDKENLEEKLNELISLYESGTDHSNKINAIYNNLVSKKSDIDALYYEINGYEDVDEENEGEVTRIDGLKDKLESSYTNITSELKDFKAELESIDETAHQKFETFIDSKKDEYLGIINKIKKLLPDALTAGLSHAFSIKKDSEIKEGLRLSGIFLKSIIGLVIISLIPFAINIYLLIDGKPFESVIADIPRVVFSILPLYIPILWLAYSSSKKINLSKRLVEEYTHKEVLSKTFEGLSSQIEEIESSEISSELRIKLLYNLLSVSSENPGKLISDYNKADHPLMDALDKSAKLSDAVEAISKIPGLSKLSSILEEKSARILEEQSKNISEALDATNNKKPNK